MLKNFKFVIIKLLSGNKVKINMNMHEQYLLKYLQNPDELSYSTEILKLNNFILEKHFILNNLNNNEIVKTLSTM